MLAASVSAMTAAMFIHSGHANNLGLVTSRVIVYPVFGTTRELLFGSLALLNLSRSGNNRREDADHPLFLQHESHIYSYHSKQV